MSNNSCPACESSEVKKIRYTLQGGLWTPFLNFAKCRVCGTRFDSKTGRINPQIPKIFRFISLIIFMALLGALIWFVGSL